jgi:hypothetical protein
MKTFFKMGTVREEFLKEFICGLAGDGFLCRNRLYQNSGHSRRLTFMRVRHSRIRIAADASYLYRVFMPLAGRSASLSQTPQRRPDPTAGRIP